jgi:multidrug efflux pump subunit AcrA (membrane-fusion protein)
MYRFDDDATVKNSRLAGVALEPGMTANVSIRTGTRTVLRYLIKPIQRGFQGALSEG